MPLWQYQQRAEPVYVPPAVPPVPADSWFGCFPLKLYSRKESVRVDWLKVDPTLLTRAESTRVDKWLPTYPNRLNAKQRTFGTTWIVVDPSIFKDTVKLDKWLPQYPVRVERRQRALQATWYSVDPLSLTKPEQNLISEWLPTYPNRLDRRKRVLPLDFTVSDPYFTSPNSVPSSYESYMRRYLNDVTHSLGSGPTESETIVDESITTFYMRRYLNDLLDTPLPPLTITLDSIPNGGPVGSVLSAQLVVEANYTRVMSTDAVFGSWQPDTKIPYGAVWGGLDVNTFPTSTFKNPVDLSAVTIPEIYFKMRHFGSSGGNAIPPGSVLNIFDVRIEFTYSNGVFISRTLLPPVDTTTSNTEGQIIISGRTVTSEIWHTSPLADWPDWMYFTNFTTTPSGIKAILNQAFSLQLTISGGLKPYTVSAPGLPTGLSINASGLISGIPGVTGQFDFTVHVIDSLGSVVDFPYSITIYLNLPQ